MPEITAYACGPKKCDHVWDGEAPIMGICPDCNGLGNRDYPKSRVCPAGFAKCGFCNGTGQIENGSTRTCSKCGQSAFSVSLWEGA